MLPRNQKRTALPKPANPPSRRSRGEVIAIASSVSAATRGQNMAGKSSSQPWQKELSSQHLAWCGVHKHGCDSDLAHHCRLSLTSLRLHPSHHSHDAGERRHTLRRANFVWPRTYDAIPATVPQEFDSTDHPLGLDQRNRSPVSGLLRALLALGRRWLSPGDALNGESRPDCRRFGPPEGGPFQGKHEVRISPA